MADAGRPPPSLTLQLPGTQKLEQSNSQNSRQNHHQNQHQNQNQSTALSKTTWSTAPWNPSTFNIGTTSNIDFPMISPSAESDDCNGSKLRSTCRGWEKESCNDELLQSTGVRDDDDNDVFYLEVGASCDENMRRGSFEERDRSIGEI